MFLRGTQGFLAVFLILYFISKEYMEKKKKGLTLGIILLLLLGALTLGGAFYLLDFALCPSMVGVAEAESRVRRAYPQVSPWLDSLQQREALRDTIILAPDGAKLHALYASAKQPTARTAVIVHGYTDQAAEMLHIGYLYHHDLDYNILLPDLRYAGLTPGESIQMGWKDREDVAAWLEVAPQLFGDSVRMVVHGISMGAATTMMLSGDSLPATVKCFVEDCGYTSVWDQFEKELKGQFGLPAFPLLHTASWLCDLKYGWNFREASALNQVKKCSLPMLFIHGDQDDYVPTWMVYELYQAKAEPKALWVTEGVDHAHSYQVYPEEYVRRVGTFTDQYLVR